MNREDLLNKKYGKDAGFKVPEGYFDDLQRKIIAELPSYPAKPSKPDLSAWQRMKPYVYLAAMFAGIWLMMKVFHNVSGDGTFSLDNPPEAIVQLWEENNFENYYFEANEPEYILEEEISESYESFDDFEKDFGYEFKPEYSNLSINYADEKKQV